MEEKIKGVGMEESTVKVFAFVAVLIAVIVGNIGMAKLDKGSLVVYTPYTLIILAVTYVLCFIAEW